MYSNFEKRAYLKIMCVNIVGIKDVMVSYFSHVQQIVNNESVVK